MRPALLAVGFVLAGSADWGLVSHDMVICAKDQAICEAAQEAIRKGWLRDWPWEGQCLPMPGCFSDESNTIKGYNR